VIARYERECIKKSGDESNPYNLREYITTFTTVYLLKSETGELS
jgi:hypothetical protein